MAESKTCERCHLIHTHQATHTENSLEIILEQTLCIEAQAIAMRQLLDRIGRETICEGCQAKIWFVRHTNGANTPYTASGLIHFVDCPERKQFARKGAAKP
jgi:hypothetical protein